MTTQANIEWAELCRRTNYPKLGYIIYRLKEMGVACRFQGKSWYAPILAVDKSKFREAWMLLSEKFGRKCLDDISDDHKRWSEFAHYLPDSTVGTSTDVPNQGLRLKNKAGSAINDSLSQGRKALETDRNEG